MPDIVYKSCITKKLYNLYFASELIDAQLLGESSRSGSYTYTPRLACLQRSSLNHYADCLLPENSSEKTSFSPTPSDHLGSGN